MAATGRDNVHIKIARLKVSEEASHVMLFDPWSPGCDCSMAPGSSPHACTQLAYACLRSLLRDAI
jgi:hypothetical protein